MSFKSLASKTSENIKDETDSLGGRSLKDSDIYPGKIKMAYQHTAASGAMALVIDIEFASGGSHRETAYVTSGKDKGCLPYSVNEKTGEKQYLPGYNLANSLCRLTDCGEITEMDTEEKTLMIYNYEAKTEVPTKVPVVVELIGKDILVGLIKQKVNKQAKGADGTYADTGETREENVIDKFFQAETRLTVPEIMTGATSAIFADQWLERNKGQVRDRTKGGSKVATIAGTKSAAPASQKKSLFSKATATA